MAKRGQASFGHPGSALLWWKAAGIVLTIAMLTGLGAFLIGLSALGGDGGAGAWLGVILGVAAVPGFGWLAAKAGDRVEYLEGGLVRHQPKRISIVAGIVILLGVLVVLWVWVFPWVDRAFINRPAVGG